MVKNMLRGGAKIHPLKDIVKKQTLTILSGSCRIEVDSFKGENFTSKPLINPDKSGRMTDLVFFPG